LFTYAQWKTIHSEPLHSEEIMITTPQQTARAIITQLPCIK